MKPNINLIGSNLRQCEFEIQKGKERKYRKNYDGKSLEYRKFFNTKKDSVDKSALDLWHYCEWIGKTPQELIQNYIDVRLDFGKLQDWRRETKNTILRYYREQKAKGYKVNMARSSVIGVMSFYSQNCEQIKGNSVAFVTKVAYYLAGPPLVQSCLNLLIYSALVRYADVFARHTRFSVQYERLPTITLV